MVENYDILKQNNLNQLVAEYENEKQKVYDNNAKRKQDCHDLMTDVALRELAEFHAREDDIFEIHLLWDKRDPRGFLWSYMKHFYDNTEANLKRKYAMIYDAKNLDKYPVATTLPRMQDLLDPYTPRDFTYETFKRLAANCPKWRQR